MEAYAYSPRKHANMSALFIAIPSASSPVTSGCWTGRDCLTCSSGSSRSRVASQLSVFDI
eukprot:5878119-Pyramimonas_sp.AAC.1